MKIPVRFFVVATLLALSGTFSETLAVTVNYTMQTGNFNSLSTERNNNPPYAGTYNNGAAELGQYANGGSFGNTPGAAAFETFTTTGNGNSGTVRALQVGDSFTITGYTSANPSSGGYIGISFRDSTTYSNFFSATDNTTEARFQLDSSGNWKVYNNGTAVDSGVGANADRTFTIKITSANTFNATVGSTTYYDLSMAASGGTIDSFAIYTFGDSNQNSFWKNASLTDTGTVEFGNGAGNGVTRTISGIIADGLAANSSSSTINNAVTISGDAGSQINFTAANTYSGATTISNNATLEIQNASGLGSTNAGTTVNSGGTLKVWSSSNLTTQAEALTLNGAGVNSGGALLNSGGNNTYAGAITLGSASRINSASGTLTLDVTSGNAINGTFQLNIGGAGSVTVNDNINISTAKLVKDGAGTLTLNAVMNYTGNTEIDQGTIAIGSGGGLASGSAVFIGSGANNSDSTLSLAGTTTFANNIQVNTSSGGGAGNRTIQKTDATAQTLSGTLANNKASTVDVVAAGGTLNMSGVISGSGTINKTGSGSLTLSGNTANSSTGAITVSTGTLVLNKSTGTAAIGGNLTINSGATLRTDAANQLNSQYVVVDGAFDMNGNNQTFALAGSGTVTNNAILTNNSTGTDTFSGVISGSGAVVKTNTGINVFSGNNTYTGGTTVGQGTLRIGAGGTTGSILGNITNNGTVTFNRSDDIIYSGIMSGTGSFQKWGAGILTLSGANTINGADHYLLDGTTLFTVSQGAGFGGNLNLGDNIGSTAATLSLTNGISINNPVIVRSGTGSRTIQSLSTSETNTLSGAITLNKDATFDSASGGGLVISGVLSGNGSMTKTGLGTVVLNANNSFSGGIIISAGTLSITNANSLGAGQFNFGNGGTLTTLLVNSNTTITNTFQIYNAATNAVLNVTANATNTISGKLTQDSTKTNSTKFGKDGAGTLILNNNNSDYNGQIQIGNGTVILGASNALGVNADVISARGVDLGLNVGDTPTANNVSLLASNNVTVGQSIWVEQNTGGATRTIGISGSGTNSFSNEVRMNTGTTLTVDAGNSSSDRVNITGAITQNAGTASGINKVGAGTLALSGANTYSGTTTVNAGTLKLERLSGGVGAASITGSTIAVNSGGTLLLGAANQIGDSTGITMSGGTLSMGNFGDSVGRLAVTAGSVFDFGNGVGQTSTFTFTDFDTAGYGGVAGLTFQNVNIGSKIVFNVNYSGNSTFNSFTDKISYSSGSLQNQISFSGGTTTLTVAAIPEPKVYVAAGALALLIGFSEYRRRKRAKSAV